MAGSHGVAAKVFGALGTAAVSVRAIAQGASERNISAVIDEQALGPGAALGAFELLSFAAHGLDRAHRAGRRRQRAARPARDADPAAVARPQARPAGARHHELASACTSPTRKCSSTRWRDAFSSRAEPADLTRFAQHIHAEHLPHAVIIDCSSSADVADRYPSWLASGIHIVTPNKKANSADLEFYARAARGAARGRCALPVRGHGRRRPAGHPDAARPARDRRYDPPHRGHALGHARLPVQRLGRLGAVLVGGARSQGARATPSPIRATTCRGRTSRAS